MNIVMITGDWPPSVSGVSDAMRIYAGDFTGNKFGKFTVITTAGNNFKPLPENGIRVFDDVKNWDFGDLKSIHKILKDSAPDIVHIQYPLTIYKKKLFVNFLPFILKILGYKVVITIHEYSYNLSYKGRIRLWPSIFFSDLILTADPVYISHIKKFFFWKKVETVPIASNIPPSFLSQGEIKELKKKITGADDSLLLGFFGFINSNKIVLPLLPVIKRLNSELKSPVKIVFIGDIGTDTEWICYLKEEIKKLSLEKDCIFTGHLEDRFIADYLSALDFAVILFKSGLSSRNATFLAAMSQGIKIITTFNPLYHPDFDGVWYIENDKNIEENIYRIIKKNESADARNSKAEGTRFYQNGWRNFLDKHIEVYNKIIKKQGVNKQ